MALDGASQQRLAVQGVAVGAPGVIIRSGHLPAYNATMPSVRLPPWPGCGTSPKKNQPQPAWPGLCTLRAVSRGDGPARCRTSLGFSGSRRALMRKGGEATRWGLGAGGPRSQERSAATRPAGAVATRRWSRCWGRRWGCRCGCSCPSRLTSGGRRSRVGRCR